MAKAGQHPSSRPRADMTASSENWYVPKSGVDYELWNRLIGIQNPERLYQAPPEDV
jgi:hypothetical protein